MMLRPEDVIRRPIALTEKAGLLREENKFVFEVALAANKIQIRDAVQHLFGVTVTSVNTLVQRGKPRRLGRRVAPRRTWKKAIVTLREGDQIQFFDETEE